MAGFDSPFKFISDRKSVVGLCSCVFYFLREHDSTVSKEASHIERLSLSLSVASCQSSRRFGAEIALLALTANPSRPVGPCAITAALTDINGSE